MEKQGVAEAAALIARIDQLMHTVEQPLMLSRAGRLAAVITSISIGWPM